MKITLINRKRSEKEQSIEKLFGFIKDALMKKHNVMLTELENPYDSGFVNLIKSLFFFRKKVGKNNIVHITGQIHFAGILLKTKKVIITVHDLGFYRNLSFIRRLFFNWFYVILPFKLANVIVVISEKTKQEILSIIPSIQSKIEVIPNCVTSSIDTENFITQKNLETILIVGTRSNKNIERAIEALKGLKIKLIIVGPLNEVHKELLIKNTIHYKNLISISEELLNNVYRLSNILLFPSVYEGFGLPILEAQAKNTIVITSNIEPLKEVSGNAALFVNPLSVESIRSGIIKALSLSSEERMNLILQGKINLEKYSVNEVSEKYYKLYEKLFQKK